MKGHRLLSPEEVRHGQPVRVVPSGEDVVRGVGLGTWQHGQEARVTDALLGACRRGAVHLYHNEPEPEEPAAPEQPAETPAKEPA